MHNVVIYDPGSGFMNGGGQIYSPEGAYKDDPDLTGKGIFSFSASYVEGSGQPTGATHFNFMAGKMRFKSSSYQLMEVNDNGGRLTGLGTINGAMAPNGKPYLFELWAGDYESPESDTFRIKIWYDMDGGYEAVTYEIDIDLPISGGTITIHN